MDYDKNKNKYNDIILEWEEKKGDINKSKSDENENNSINSYKDSNTFQTSGKVSSKNNQENFSKNGKIVIYEDNDKENVISNEPLEVSKKIKLNKIYYTLNSDQNYSEDYNYSDNISKIIFSYISKSKIEINENIVILSYSNFFVNKRNLLVIYDKSSQKIYRIEGYCFSVGLNGFAIMNNKYFIYLCKKTEQRGKFWNNFENIFLKFEETFQNFNITSISPFLIKGLKETDYFLVSGIDIKKK